MCEDRAHARGASADGGNDPERLFGTAGALPFDDEARAVARYVGDGDGAKFFGQGDWLDFRAAQPEG